MVSNVWKVIQEEVLERFWAQSVQKVDFFQKLRLALWFRVRVRVSFSRCEMTTFDKPACVPRLGK